MSIIHRLIRRTYKILTTDIIYSYLTRKAVSRLCTVIDAANYVTH